jgi:6-phosphogluconolactonase (cycloisomerase 2 family)
MRTRLLLSGATLLLAAACADRSTTVTGPRSESLTPSADRVAARGDRAVGAVFTATNAADRNAVIAFARAGDGSLAYAGTFPTGGTGIGGGTDPLASQFSLLLSPDHQLLFVANAGSNDISVFRVGDAAQLQLVQTIASGGVRPVSLALADRALYALNQGSNTVTGFELHGGRLVAVPAWTRPLSAGASGGAEVRFSRDGGLLAVTERLSSTIDTYLVRNDGSLGAPIRNASSGAGPFGFDFNKTGRLVVSEAGPGTVSTYAAWNGALQVRTASAPTHQRAPCWLVVTPNGYLAYTANAGSGTLTGFAVAPDGTLLLLDPTGVSASLGATSTPLDLDTSDDGQFLYVLKAGTGTIGALAVGRLGTLTPLGDVSVGAPNHGQQGLAAY